MVLLSAVQLRTDSRCVAIFKLPFHTYPKMFHYISENVFVFANKELFNPKMKKSWSARHIRTPVEPYSAPKVEH